MTGGPRLTVGVPVRNGANFIRPALDSLLVQTYRDFAVLVSDNASTDGTVAIVEEYMERHPNIHLQRHPVNIGAHRNYNALVTASTGELFKWMAHDDLIAPTFLAECVARLDADPGASLAFANSGQIDEEGRVTGDLASSENYVDPSPYRRLRSYVADHTKIPQVFGVMRRSVLEATPLLGSYPKSDTVLMYEMAMRGRFAMVDEPLFLNRDHPSRQGRLGLRERTAWYHPDRSSPLLPRWNQLRGFTAATLRVPMPASDKVRCVAFALWWGVRHGLELGGEIGFGLRQWLQRWRGGATRPAV
ncbi:MAG: glycosyltransferase family 2 protein [Actinomycetota bacterium]|nr:glycosyltransferase family 2 protein [Actinomycetota bacterium]